jgi:hypothetical protein
MSARVMPDKFNIYVCDEGNEEICVETTCKPPMNKVDV